MSLQIDANDYSACYPYNEWLDEQYTGQFGLLNILGFQPRPSFVLFSLSYDTYQAAFADFQQRREEDLKESVLNEFPSPIAYYFYRFEHGYENELQRLHLLRDTWEATCDFLHAMAIAECRFRRISLAEPIAFSHLLTDGVAQRLLNVERIVVQAAKAGANLVVAQIASVATIGTMRDLNQTRNAFSHSAAQSETQARNWVAECYGDVLHVLEELRGLRNVDVMRYVGQSDANTLRCEMFKGHSSTRTISQISLTADQVRDASLYFRQGQLLVLGGGSIFSLQPMIHYREDAAGHTTRICLFRKTRGDVPSRRIEYEVVGEATRLDVDRSAFRGELSELRSLFGLGPD